MARLINVREEGKLERSRDAVVDVVFVHGLGGTPRDTWSYRRKTGLWFWPRSLAEAQPDFEIWSLAYYVPVFGSAGPLYEQAGSCLDLMVAQGLGSKPLCFVAHSMGGLLVKQMIKNGSEIGQQFKPLVGCVRGVVFLGTPHFGSWIANVVRFLPCSSTAIKELRRGNPYLRELHDWFRTNYARLGIEVKSYGETQSILGTLLVVSRESADPQLGEQAIFLSKETHDSLAKPRSAHDHVYLAVRKFLVDVMRKPLRTVESELSMLLHEFPPQPADKIDPYGMLSVARSEYVDRYAEKNERPPYIVRDADTELDTQLTTHRCVLITGRSRSGKSRTAFEAVMRHFPHHFMIVPVRPGGENHAP